VQCIHLRKSHYMGGRERCYLKQHTLAAMDQHHGTQGRETIEELQGATSCVSRWWAWHGMACHDTRNGRVDNRKRGKINLRGAGVSGALSTSGMMALGSASPRASVQSASCLRIGGERDSIPSFTIALHSSSRTATCWNSASYSVALITLGGCVD
jgi:hypothetical protein